MRKTILTLAALLVILNATAVQARSEGVVFKRSAYSVSETINRLVAIFKERGITVFARVDHAAGAEKIGKKLAPAELVIFGNPKIGTPLMQSNIVSGIDLPLKAMAYQNASGAVELVYNHPGYTARRHGIEDRDALVQEISKILTNLTDLATKKK